MRQWKKAEYNESRQTDREKQLTLSESTFARQLFACTHISNLLTGCLFLRPLLGLHDDDDVDVDGAVKDESSEADETQATD